MLNLNLDLNPGSRELVGETGLDFAAWQAEYPEVIAALTDDPPGYTRLPEADPTALLDFAAARVDDLDDVILLGIGGSGLGARMLR
ncbi:MAG: hypothetical protein GF403_04815, partial [Candidatus Coatesbacteria bacterium]|nr:hypothetical protein [Candidatus Coatesbacteria bacterium]